MARKRGSEQIVALFENGVAVAISGAESQLQWALLQRPRWSAGSRSSRRLQGWSHRALGVGREQLHGRHRVRLLAQSAKDFDLSGYVRFWLNSAERVKGNLRVQVDIDPMSFY